MKKTLIAAAAVISIGFGANAGPVDYFTGFAGFGDSLSDKGRNNGFSAPSLDSRFSNGKTWMELIGDQFEMRDQANVNLALGGATAGDTNLNDPLYQFVDSVTPRDPSNPDDINLFELGTFSRQITSFVNAGFDAAVGDNPLVGLLFGGNDFLQASSSGFNPFAVAADVVNGVRQIVEIDGKFDDFVILNLPDLSATPLNASLGAAEKANIRAAVEAFNLGLVGGLAALEAELELTPGVDMNFQIVDLFSINDALLASADTLGLRLDSPCTTSISDPNAPFNQCPTVESADDFFFVDAVHPNRIVHAQIADNVLPLIESRLSPVPLPAGLPLLLAGLGAFALVRRRAA